jgi:hypothetical protein
VPPAIPPASAPAARGATSAPAEPAPTAPAQPAPSAPAEPEPADLAVAGITGVGPQEDAAPHGTEQPAPAEPATAAKPPRRSTSVFAARGAGVGAGAAAAGGDAPTTAPDPSTAEPRHDDLAQPEPEYLEPDLAEPQPGAGGADGPGHPVWDLPFPAEQPAEPLAQRRFDPTRWVIGGVAVAVIVGVIIAIGNVLSPFRSAEDGQSQPAPTASAPAVEAPPEGEEPAGDAEQAPAAAPPVVATITSIDPSDGDGEHEELVGRLVDGDPATTWYTHTYNRPDFAGFKDAVGLAITLQAPATVTSITIDGLGNGGSVEVRSTDAANPTAGDVLAAGALAAPQTVLTLAQPTETQSLVLWFTSLSQTPDGANKIELSTVAVS